VPQLYAHDSIPFLPEIREAASSAMRLSITMTLRRMEEAGTILSGIVSARRFGHKTVAKELLLKQHIVERRLSETTANSLSKRLVNPMIVIGVIRSPSGIQLPKFLESYS
jgi:hypothetical protein